MTSQQIASKKYYNNNKDKIAEYTTNKKRKMVEAIHGMIEGLCCFDCGIPFKGQPWMADFHHIHPRESRWSISKTYGHSAEKITKELNGGIYICPNCHRIRHRVGIKKCRKQKFRRSVL